MKNMPQSHVFLVGGKILAPVGRRELSLLGCFQERVKAPQTNIATVTDVYVMKGKASNMLGCETTEKLGLITSIKKVDEVSFDKVVDYYKDILEGLGKMKGVQVKLNINEDVKPIAQKKRRLTKHDSPWKWGEDQQQSFSELKDRIADWEMLSYFDTKLPTELVVDASPHGIGAVLTHKNTDRDISIIDYGVRALTESRYSQTKREALELCWGCEHLNHYLEVVVVTDHKPIKGIKRKVTSLPTARLHRIFLRLQPYKMEVVYRPGKMNPADYLSRHPPST